MQFIINLIIILIIAFIIGEQRRCTGKALGFRSLSLVMIGAYTFTFLSTDNFVVIDWHVIAQIVTGISFVGAGLIIKNGDIRNLTTAILAWTMGAIAVLIGLNHLLEAIVLSVTVFFILLYKEQTHEDN